ncbi:hypothetical protein LQF60_04910 [Tetragenococcus koreensis]|uniref:Uncharacterized protein n=1 Tax=Tetragenococcus koreensis TaxID=290335 RepID=A0AAN4UAR8_9ENTE|nr:hypothetical protein [Tetragenococcus koreensis]MCF1629175.1 hypothetical protein [Tetragenococcus koreensis]MCF1657380.1 hypothetical protein [Tetragenococcus koreensis]MDN6288932.1 hypothetical protein [Tetragenococcus koreensis]MDN6343955.1 hypothetical protein [Tetragenococcus koreensis]MDN6422389.1 hypothetical protein [Tetragenococcus koreensis]
MKITKDEERKDKTLSEIEKMDNVLSIHSPRMAILEAEALKKFVVVRKYYGFIELFSI